MQVIAAALEVAACFLTVQAMDDPVAAAQTGTARFLTGQEMTEMVAATPKEVA